MYVGDFAEDATVYCWWNSNDSNGASITRATNGTISVYKDDNVAQSAAGVTDTEDFDALPGVHLVEVDTSADAFYEVGHDYGIVLSAATINGQTVNAVLGQFSIENRAGLSAGALEPLETDIEAMATVLAAIQALTDKLDSMIEASDGGYRYTDSALEEAPSGGGGSGGMPAIGD